MTERWVTPIAAIALSFAALSAGMAKAQSEMAVTDGRRAGQTVAVREARMQNGVVSGVIVNHGARPVRDVELLVRHNFLWKQERRPGGHSPGRSSFHLVPGEIAPGGAVTFTYRPDVTLAPRPDGHFETIVEVAGFTEIGGSEQAGDAP